MIGKKVNNYELREVVGDGAMGVVYLAEHPVLRRRVAVKLLKRHFLESPSVVTRFVNEARAAAAIHHPNVIEVIDVGVLDDGAPYIMMEYLEGEPLARRLARERLGVGQAVDILIQAAGAVAASHALEIVHRDLKPENLFLVPDATAPGGERVKVLDFGIAKLRPDWGGSDSPKTRTGFIFGTPAYMSPEQCRGLNAEVDDKTDIYALGCILFELLCGRPPFSSVGWGDVLMMHMQTAIPVPSAENPAVPAAVDQVVTTALAKNKLDRFPTMRDMQRALAQARNQVGDKAAPQQPMAPTLFLTDVQGAERPEPASPRARLRYLVLVGVIVLGGAAALALVGRRPDGTGEPPAPPAKTPITTVDRPAAIEEREPVASEREAGGAPVVSPSVPAKAKPAKSHRRPEARRKDPVKW
jgi:serine/threonine-protein kinase